MNPRFACFIGMLTAAAALAGCPAREVPVPTPRAEAAPAPATHPESPTSPAKETSTPETDSMQPSELDPLVAGNTAFALDLYQRLAGEPGNIFVSPHSISTALALTYAGARGATAAGMAKALRFRIEGGPLHAAFGELQRRLNAGAGEDYALAIANALWLQQDFEFIDAFLEVGRMHYEAAMRELPFANDPEGARLTINGWVADRTRQKIPELLSGGTIGADTRLVLTNAIYFKGQWIEEFDPEKTEDQPFHLSGGASVSAPLMFKEAKFGYAEDDMLQILEMAYRGDDLSMIVLLPRASNTLADIEKAMTPERLEQWIGAVNETEVLVHLPKFSFRSNFELNGPLAQMGMADAFGGAADFSGMTGRRDLSISAVIHEAFIDVNEEGTEAAAATAVVIRLTAMPNAKPEFRADRPFLFLILDRATGTVLFLGRVSNPKA